MATDLPAGHPIRPYRILRPIGRGGMGEVTGARSRLGQMAQRKPGVLATLTVALVLIIGVAFGLTR